MTSSRKTTLLLVKGSRPISSFTVPGCLVGLVLLLLLASVTLALLLYYGYFGLQDQIAGLRKTSQHLEKKIAALKPPSRPVLGLTPPPPPPQVQPKVKPKPPPKLVKVVKKPPAGPKPDNPKPPAVKPPPPPLKKKVVLAERQDWPLMHIANLKVTPNTKGLRVRFDLKSAKPGAEQLEGYFFVLGVDTTADPPIVAPHSKVELVKYLPQNYKRGMSFSFKYQKPGNAVTVRYPPGSQKFNKIYVVIFDKGGQLKVIKAFDVPS
ncbi:MAG: hypothetical protein KJ621_12810 [Proteobacteria bacterium]|nr:hypothetical protein [Pseudomonadota bacterium]MBU1742684.1 hypothetical protein [Pseudomonadota bacterium]